MTGVEFESLYRADPDPWRYTTSAYERDKYASTLAACGPGPFECALELGSSIGVFSERLADRCVSLTTIDSAPTAVRLARTRLAGRPSVEVILGEIPAGVPRRRYDLVVASEILYYLRPAQLSKTLALLRRQLAIGGLLVAVHWRPAGPERPFTAAQIHAQLKNVAWLSPVRSRPTPDYLLDVMERR